MRIGEFIGGRGRSLSFEFFPPKDKASEDQLFENMARFEALNPAFVSVTYGAGGGTLKNTTHVILRILQETSLVPMPHLTCVDQSRNELEAILRDYMEHGIDNVLALRGDPPKGAEKFTPPQDGFCYAKDLVQLAASLSSFSIGVAVYPEGHCESPNLGMDMYYTKQKIDAGADFAITQMFFDNSYFYGFLERVAKADIKVPIIAGIMAITDIERIRTFSKRCGATLPDKIIHQFEKAGSTAEEAKKVGIEIATEQCADLLEHGLRYFHFYTLNQSDAVLQVVSNLGLQNLGAERDGGLIKSG
ncbi:MAG TPA: methylenetetrahydrofolate reductase [NAD(P)H] [Dehalococcoidia bacterium]|nr:methylenetetrahydrofolate reductase [NAD(P)H] [Dehalococcoidia bacterium]